MQQQHHMKNWFLLLMILTVSYMVHQKVNGLSKPRPRISSAASFISFKN